MAHQLLLDLEARETYAAEDLIVTGANRAVVELLQQPVWLHPHLLLTGLEGSGKTHLGHAFADMTPEALYLTAGQTEDLDVAAIAHRDVVIDDADKASQTALFHLFNTSLANNKRLLLLSRRHPLEWRIALPDLTSRLKAMRVIDVPEPDDALLIALLKRHFARRAISPSAEAIEFMARRMERSMHGAQKIVTELAQYSNGRPFNRALVIDFMENRNFAGQSENLSWLTDQDDL